MNLGLALLQTQETPEAKSAFSRALLMEPRNSTALLELTQIELTEGDVAAASGYYERYRTDTRRQTARALILGVEIARLNGDANMEAVICWHCASYTPKRRFIRRGQLPKRSSVNTIRTM